MDNSLLINTYIRTILCSDEDITALLTNPETNEIKIYPVNAFVSIPDPFVVIRHESIVPEYTKDGCYENTVDVIVFVVDADYDNGVILTNKIRNKLDRCVYNTNDVYIYNIELANAIEYVERDKYVQQLNFRVYIAN